MKFSLTTKIFLFLIIFLSFFGIFFVFNSSTVDSFLTYADPYRIFKNQLMWLSIGISAFVIANIFPLELWKKLSYIFYFLGIFLLISVFIPHIGVQLNGANRWISIGSFILQPIEFFKFIMISLLAYLLSEKAHPYLLLTFIAIPIILTLLQPDLGSTLILATICLGMYFSVHKSTKNIILIGVMGILAVSLLVVSSPYRRERLMTFINPERDPLGSSFHIRQITFALANGGKWGAGIGNSKQKYAYIPEVASDSIFAIIAEELGFLGSIFLINLFLLYTFIGFRISIRAKNSYYQLLGLGVTIWISSQAFLNLAAVAALLPLTGLPLPFISHGGSSLITVLFANGVIFKISRET